MKARCKDKQKQTEIVFYPRCIYVVCMDLRKKQRLLHCTELHYLFLQPSLECLLCGTSQVFKLDNFVIKELRYCPVAPPFQHYNITLFPLKDEGFATQLNNALLFSNASAQGDSRLFPLYAHRTYTNLHVRASASLLKVCCVYVIIKFITFSFKLHVSWRHRTNYPIYFCNNSPEGSTKVDV